MDQSTPPNAPGPQWFYVLSGQRAGPIDHARFLELIAGGQVTGQTLVWTEGMAEWMPAERVPQLAQACAASTSVRAAPPTAAGPVMIAERPWQSGEYAGFWIRFVAYVIDGIVIGTASTLLRCALSGVVIGAVGALHGIGARGGTVSGRGVFEIWVVLLAGFLIQCIAIWLYSAIMESSKHQATLGKMAMSLRVTTTGGAPITFAQASGRFFGKILSVILLGIGFIMAAFTEKKQALHDMLAGTVVVRRG